MAAPTPVFTFCTDATNRVSIPSAKRTEGFVGGQGIGEGYVNQSLYEIGLWVTFMADFMPDDGILNAGRIVGTGDPVGSGNGLYITSESNGDIAVIPDGSGSITLFTPAGTGGDIGIGARLGASFLGTYADGHLSGVGTYWHIDLSTYIDFDTEGARPSRESTIGAVPTVKTVTVSASPVAFTPGYAGYIVGVWGNKDADAGSSGDFITVSTPAGNAVIFDAFATANTQLVPTYMFIGRAFGSSDAITVTPTVVGDAGGTVTIMMVRS